MADLTLMDGRASANAGTPARCEAPARARNAGGSGAKGGIPLSFVIVRYFAYVFVLLAVVWLAAFTAFSATINLGVVYAANYGPAHVDETVADLRARDGFDPAALPTAYRYALLDAGGGLVESDLAGAALDRASEVARAWLAGAGSVLGPDDPATVTGSGGGVTHAVFWLPDGTACVLACTYMPQFVSRALCETLPNPQNLMLAAGCAGSVVAIGLIARRASSVLTRKMAPLTDAAERIARENLDVAVGSSNVRQINDVLAAMERMRVALGESLEARWRAEEAQHAQMAALAHDLKTPLTVVRANAEYLAEAADDCGADGGLRCGDGACEAGARDAADLRDAALAVERASRQLDDYVRLIIEAARGRCGATRLEAVEADALVDEAVRDAGELAQAAGVQVRVARSAEFERGVAGETAVHVDRTAFSRAVQNLVANAVERTPCGGAVRLGFDRRLCGGAAGAAELVVTVDDDGPGFSPAALEHGCERFYRDDAARSGGGSQAGGSDGGRAGGEGARRHYGLGLAIAAEVAATHGGRVELANRSDAAGKVLGARVVLAVPWNGPARG